MTIKMIPQDATFEITSYLSTEEICALSATCHKFARETYHHRYTVSQVSLTYKPNNELLTLLLYQLPRLTNIVFQTVSSNSPMWAVSTKYNLHNMQALKSCVTLGPAAGNGYDYVARLEALSAIVKSSIQSSPFSRR